MDPKFIYNTNFFEIRTSDFKPRPAYDIFLRIMELKLRPSENSLADFCTSALMKALKINLLYSKKVYGEAFWNAEVQKSAGEFSHGLDIKSK